MSIDNQIEATTRKIRWSEMTCNWDECERLELRLKELRQMKAELGGMKF